MSDMRSAGDIGGTARLLDMMRGRFGSEFSERMDRVMAMTPEERTREKVEAYNRSAGDLGSGVDCPECLNRGYIGFVNDRGFESYRECGCMERRAAWERIQQSGLGGLLDRCSFKSFSASSDWQKAMLEKAVKWCREGINNGKWLYIGGSVGAGKTHLCTAVCRHILKEKPVIYMPWQSESIRIKAGMNDAEVYSEAVRRLKTVAVLYIDDFLKPAMDGDPTGADIRLAYDIINARYVSKLPTIISSERPVNVVMELDEAVGSRIWEMCGEYAVTLTGNKNQRLGVTG